MWEMYPEYKYMHDRCAPSLVGPATHGNNTYLSSCSRYAARLLKDMRGVHLSSNVGDRLLKRQDQRDREFQSTDNNGSPTAEGNAPFLARLLPP